MNVQDTVAIIKGGHAHGSVCVPTSKSIAHRMLICAALVKDGTSHISGVPYNDDIDATMDCLRALGVQLKERRDEQGNTRTVTVQGRGGCFADSETLNCRESGSTLRFMIPLCLLSDAAHELKGSTRLLERPLGDYHVLLASRKWQQGTNVLNIGKGVGLNGGVFSLEGKTSSQFVTGLLLVLPLLSKNSIIALSQAPESRSYIDMTLAVMARFGISARWQDEKTIAVGGGQCYTACDATVDGDASGAAFFHGLNALGGNVAILNDDPCSNILQGDSICPQLLDRIIRADEMNMPIISLADCPDLGPILFAVAATKKGTLFTHTARLRLKESDRVTAMATELRKFGADIVISDENASCEMHQRLQNALDQADPSALATGWVYVSAPKNSLSEAREVLSGHNDHRIVMALAILGSVVGQKTTIREAAAVQKSFPEFFDCLRALGIEVETNW